MRMPVGCIALAAIAGYRETPCPAPTITAQVSNAMQTLRAVTFDGTRYRAVGYQGTLVTARPLAQDVVWNGSQYLTVGSNGEFCTSPDDANWTAHNGGAIGNRERHLAVARHPRLGRKAGGGYRPRLERTRRYRHVSRRRAMDPAAFGRDRDVVVPDPRIDGQRRLDRLLVGRDSSFSTNDGPRGLVAVGEFGTIFTAER